MIFRQFVHDDLGCASYLVGDEHAGVAAVVDPRLDIDEYLRAARYLGVRIEHILETHNHADHVSGHGRLAAATGAIIHVHSEARPEYEHEVFDDGWELALGELIVRALHTPGHRPEHTAFALVDTARSSEPWAVLSGDTLFVGDVARPDLAVDKEEGARGIFHSLHQKLLPLPDVCEVWPGHLGGSLCGGPGMDLKISSTIGFERANQPLLSVADEAEFVKRTTSTLGPQPPNFKNIVAINRGPLLIETVDAHPLTPRQVQQAEADGALVVDVRTDLQFDDAHIPRAVCITARRAGFGSRLAWLADPEQPLVLVGRDDEDAREAAELAGAVGLGNIGGFLAGGMTSWREDQLDVELGGAAHGARAARALGGGQRRHAGARRARAGGVGCRPHRRVGAPAVPRHPRPAGRAPPRRIGGGDLRVGPALRRRREPAAALRRAGCDPRGGWRSVALGARGLAHRAVAFGL